MTAAAIERAPGSGRPEPRPGQEPPCDDPDRAFVMQMARGLVEAGVAGWTALESGDIRLALASGEIFHLGQDCITRIR